MELRTGAAPDTEYDTEFMQGMVDRMAVSYHKYGQARHARKNGMLPLKSLLARIERYEETGNTEWLIDVANFAMIEFMDPGQPNAHFRATDSGESPGRVTVAGTTSSPNSDILGARSRKTREGD